ncbi:MAG: GNAT family N-acetyltransferase [Thermoanaerobaculia bacterium]|nr:GNAT family N-acetyltransferase [Thermoanaerobaculia bacterium]
MTEIDTSAAAIFTTDQVDSAKLNAFLKESFGEAKSEFLRKHGDWWHGGPENRWVIMVGEEIAGYCAVIPTKILIQGDETPALWWVDLLVDSKYRGKGLQSHFDARIRAIADLKLGFPNELATKIHRKHGWGINEDLKVLLVPFQPTRIKSVKNAEGLLGTGVRLGALALSPLFAGIRWALARYQPKAARRVVDPAPEWLSEIFFRNYDAETITTMRDASYVQWRFLDAPYGKDLKYYSAGPAETPSQVLITRETYFQGIHGTRILDFFGEIQDKAATRDLFLCAMKDMIESGSTQAIVLTSIQGLEATLRKIGFVIPGVTRFCWYSEEASTMARLEYPGFWALADSDNDAPD